jgi:hypothetical protein
MADPKSMFHLTGQVQVTTIDERRFGRLPPHGRVIRKRPPRAIARHDETLSRGLDLDKNRQSLDEPGFGVA